MNAEGITDAATVERIAKAEARQRLLRGAGINRPKLGSVRLRMIYGALIEPVWTYALHVSQFSATVREKAAKLIDAATKWMSTNLPPKSRIRMRRLLALRDADVQRRRQQLALLSRLEGVWLEAMDEEIEAQTLATAMDAQMASTICNTTSALGEPDDTQTARWTALEDGRRRKRRIAAAQGVELHALWRLPSTRHSTCAAN